MSLIGLLTLIVIASPFLIAHATVSPSSFDSESLTVNISVSLRVSSDSSLPSVAPALSGSSYNDLSFYSGPDFLARLQRSRFSALYSGGFTLGWSFPSQCDSVLAAEARRWNSKSATLYKRNRIIVDVPGEFAPWKTFHFVGSSYPMSLCHYELFYMSYLEPLTHELGYIPMGIAKGIVFTRSKRNKVSHWTRYYMSGLNEIHQKHLEQFGFQVKGKVENHRGYKKYKEKLMLNNPNNRIFQLNERRIWEKVEPEWIIVEF